MDNNGNKRRINFEEEQPSRIRRRDFDLPGPSNQTDFNEQNQQQQRQQQQQQQQHQQQHRPVSQVSHQTRNGYVTDFRGAERPSIFPQVLIPRHKSCNY